MSDAAVTHARPTVSGSIIWWMVLVEGIAAVVLGLFLLTRPALTAIVIVQFIGVWWLLTGILEIVDLVRDRTAWVLKLATGLLGVLAGIAVIAQPLISPLIMGAVYIIILGVNGLFIGAINLYRSLTGGGWAAGVLGVLSLLFSFLILASPIASAAALPFLFGILGIVYGGTAVFGSLQLKKAFTLR
jgi:uncharacterized membrane protein HdeD (DUF308 family)